MGIMHHKKEAARERMIIPVLLPIGRDAELVGTVFDNQNVEIFVCASMHDLLSKILSQCGPFIVGDEAISDESLHKLAELLDNQPDWSNLPGIILIGQMEKIRRFDMLAVHSEISLIQRPVRRPVLTSVIHSAIEARRRQYQVKELLEDLVRTNEKLRSRTEMLQKLALDLTNAENNERKRIGQVLHDDLQQMIASARMQTEILIGDLVNSELAQTAQPVYDILTQAMNTSRNLSHELNPAFVIGGNLKGALQNKAVQLGEQYGFQVQMTFDLGDAKVDEDISIFIFRSVQELIFNCAKHAKASHVCLELSRMENFIKIVAEDDGVGFDPRQLNVCGGIEGGFGLFSIQERAIALGGSFDIQSTPDKGSRFCLKFPALSEPAATDGKQIGSEDTHHDKKEKAHFISVLIADDHAVMREGLAALLQNQADIKVVAEASDGEQAVAYALELRPDLVLMDYSMPVLEGPQATRMIKNKAPDIGVIGLSMYSGEDKQKNMYEAGANAFLKKDVQAAELIAAIKKHAKQVPHT
jgi:signal transduction histidine kinase/ActR/RegA family two-component response regulator